MKNTALNPIVFYGRKAFYMIGKVYILFLMWERKVLRQDFGSATALGVWRNRTIQELKEGGACNQNDHARRDKTIF